MLAHMWKDFRINCYPENVCVWLFSLLKNVYYTKPIAYIKTVFGIVYVTVSSSVHNMIYRQEITCTVNKWMEIIQLTTFFHVLLHNIGYPCLLLCVA
jgi:hypothetical protein